VDDTGKGQRDYLRFKKSKDRGHLLKGGRLGFRKALNWTQGKEFERRQRTGGTHLWVLWPKKSGIEFGVFALKWCDETETKKNPYCADCVF